MVTTVYEREICSLHPSHYPAKKVVDRLGFYLNILGVDYMANFSPG